MTSQAAGGDARTENVKEPQTIVREMEKETPLPSGHAERFLGYAVIGLPFASGHLLAMRRAIELG